MKIFTRKSIALLATASAFSFIAATAAKADDPLKYPPFNWNFNDGPVVIGPKPAEKPVETKPATKTEAKKEAAKPAEKKEPAKPAEKKEAAKPAEKKEAPKK